MCAQSGKGVEETGPVNRVVGRALEGYVGGGMKKGGWMGGAIIQR